MDRGSSISICVKNLDVNIFTESEFASNGEGVARYEESLLNSSSTPLSSVRIAYPISAALICDDSSILLTSTGSLREFVWGYERRIVSFNSWNCSSEREIFLFLRSIVP